MLLASTATVTETSSTPSRRPTRTGGSSPSGGEGSTVAGR